MCQEIYITSNQQYVMYIQYLEILSCSHLISCKIQAYSLYSMKSIYLTISSVRRFQLHYACFRSLQDLLKFAYLLASSGSTKLPCTTRKRPIGNMDINGAPHMWCAISVHITNGAPLPRCATTNKFLFYFPKLVMAHQGIVRHYQF